jgi:type IV fimbrial biogenesis protein FimT
MLSRSQTGFTLIELLVTILVLSIIFAFGVPALGSFIERAHLKNAAETIYGQIQYGRSESIKQSSQMYVNFSADGSSIWSLGISATSGCVPTDGLADASPCKISMAGTDVLKTTVNAASSPQYPNIKMTVNPSPFEITFEPVRGTATAGTVTLISGSGWEIRNIISILGHVSMCSPAGAAHVAGYPEC